MPSTEYETMAGRIDGVARAVLHLAAALEVNQVIDGPRLSRMWRAAVAPDSQHGRAESRRILQEMADLLDEARARRAEAH